MNNDARFFFVFFGFTGFILLGLASLIIHQKFVLSVVHGVIGCLIFAIVGRNLMNFSLKHQLQRIPKTVQQPVSKNNIESVVAESNGDAINFTKEQSDSIKS